MKKNLTVKQVHDACKKHKYLLFRLKSGEKVGVNGKVADIARKKHLLHDREETRYVGFQSCSFQEYISHKWPFIEI